MDSEECSERCARDNMVVGEGAQKYTRGIAAGWGCTRMHGVVACVRKIVQDNRCYVELRRVCRICEWAAWLNFIGAGKVVWLRETYLKNL